MEGGEQEEDSCKMEGRSVGNSESSQFAGLAFLQIMSEGATFFYGVAEIHKLGYKFSTDKKVAASPSKATIYCVDNIFVSASKSAMFDTIIAYITFLQDIDYDGFRQFLDAFLDCEAPEELSRHLFVSFIKPSFAQAQLQSKVLSQMAAVSSNAACAAVTSHTKGEYDQVVWMCEPTSEQVPAAPLIIYVHSVSPEPRQSFVDKIHGITEKLQLLSYIGHTESGSGESKGKSGRATYA